MLHHLLDAWFCVQATLRTDKIDGCTQELHNYQAWVIAELLEPIQWARAETTAFPQMMDALAIGAHCEPLASLAFERAHADGISKQGQTVDQRGLTVIRRGHDSHRTKLG